MKKRTSTVTLTALVLFALFLLVSSNAGASSSRGVGVIFHAPKASGKSAEQVDLYHTMTAVVIGIDRYQNLPSKNFLKYAVKDAKGVATVLREKYPFKKIITLLSNLKYAVAI